MDVELLEQIVKLMARQRPEHRRRPRRRQARDPEARRAARSAERKLADGYARRDRASRSAGHRGFARGCAALRVAGSGDDTDGGLVPIKSPMVGTFYSASSPDAKPFVSVGIDVDEETDVCIIEAMKVFNNIKAEMPRHDRQDPGEQRADRGVRAALFLVKPS